MTAFDHLMVKHDLNIQRGMSQKFKKLPGRYSPCHRNQRSTLCALRHAMWGCPRMPYSFKHLLSTLIRCCALCLRMYARPYVYFLIFYIQGGLFRRALGSATFPPEKYFSCRGACREGTGCRRSYQGDGSLCSDGIGSVDDFSA